MLASNRTAIRVISSEADIAEGLAYLAALEPRFQSIALRLGPPPLRRAPAGLPGLLRIVTEQMLSLKAADVIWRRIERELHPLDPQAILRRRHATLMKLGLSGAKARAFKAIARAALKGDLPIDRLDQHHDEDAAARLTAIPGIGNWTADIYLLSCLGRSDIWPAADLALQAAAAHAFELARRPAVKEMLALAEPWRPWRAVAARLLWAHYRSLKGMPQAVV
jgi:DNA-3-methyladenine glycosylase II